MAALELRTEIFLAILNLFVAPMPSTKFQLNPTYGLGEDAFWRVSRKPPWRLPWLLEQNDYSNLILHIATITPTKWQLNPTYDSGKDVENVKS